MPKHNFMISKAVDLVAKKLAGMDADTINRLTKALGEEAQIISEELQHSGQNVNADIIAAKLDGLVTRMKYEVRNQGPDPSPHEFPIFNVSHNPTAPYPNPINHLYDKRYKEAYSTFIKQNQQQAAAQQTSQPSTPNSPEPPPLPPKTPVTPNAPNQPNQSQGQYQQGQTQQFGFRHQPINGWQYVNPYATMPRAHAAQYQHQASRVNPAINNQAGAAENQRIRRSSTGEDLRTYPLSRSASSNDLDNINADTSGKIRVRVIGSNTPSSTIDPPVNPNSRSRMNSQRSILKPNNEFDDNADVVTTRRIYSTPDTALGPETIQDLFQVASQSRTPQAGPSATPMTERVIIIDRRGADSPSDPSNNSGSDRFRTFEIRTETTPVPNATPGAPTSTNAAPSTNSLVTNPYAVRLPNYYVPQHGQGQGQGQRPAHGHYQQPKIYSSTPNNMFSANTPFVANPNAFYPFYYQY